MTDSRASNRRRSVGAGLILGIGLTLGALLLSRWVLQPSQSRAERTELNDLPAEAAQRAPRASVPESVNAATFVGAMPVYPAVSAQPNGAGQLPHAITPTHERIFNENSLLGTLDGAMDVKDVAGMRQLLEQYREEYPEDAHEMQTGYELIADCLDELTPERRARAKHYYDSELASGLRRYIRRHCLEGA